MEMKFIKEGPDKKGRTFIIEGTEKSKGEFCVHRFVCEVQVQNSIEETQQLADMLVQKLNQK